MGGVKQCTKRLKLEVAWRKWWMGGCHADTGCQFGGRSRVNTKKEEEIGGVREQKKQVWKYLNHTPIFMSMHSPFVGWVNNNFLEAVAQRDFIKAKSPS